jgi:hypothetical protein
VISPSQRPLHTQDNTTYKHKRQTSMPSAGFEPVTQAATDLCLRPPATGIDTIQRNPLLVHMNLVHTFTPISFTSILILSSHLNLYVRSGFPLQILRTKLCMHLSLQFVLHDQPTEAHRSMCCTAQTPQYMALTVCFN